MIIRRFEEMEAERDVTPLLNAGPDPSSGIGGSKERGPCSLSAMTGESGVGYFRVNMFSASCRNG